MRLTVTFINGSPRGSRGNSAALLDLAEKSLGSEIVARRITLEESLEWPVIESILELSDGYVFGTGTYWDSWGSPLQKFLETATPTEGTPLWLGKPAVVLVSMNSVGGKSVLSRLQGVLSTLGASIPPHGGLVCSLAAQLALQSAPTGGADDFWRPDDVSVVCHNLLEALRGAKNWRTWPVDRECVEGKWI